MDVSEPRSRHRGYFLHSDTAGEYDTTEQENPEGFKVRFHISSRLGATQLNSTVRPASPTRYEGGRARTEVAASDEGRPAIRSGSVTGSRQRAHLPR
jgi:hypothetical protein